MDVFVFDFKYVCVRYLEGRYVRVACFGIGWKRKSEGEVSEREGEVTDMIVISVEAPERQTDWLICLSVQSVCSYTVKFVKV